MWIKCAGPDQWRMVAGMPCLSQKSSSLCSEDAPFSGQRGDGLTRCPHQCRRKGRRRPRFFRVLPGGGRLAGLVVARGGSGGARRRVQQQGGHGDKQVPLRKGAEHLNATAQGGGNQPRAPAHTRWRKLAAVGPRRTSKGYHLCSFTEGGPPARDAQVEDVF